MNCPKCGSENVPSSKFCVKCGTAITANPNVSNIKNDNNEKKKNHTLLIVLIIILIVIICIFFAIRALFKKINSFNFFRIDDIPFSIIDNNKNDSKIKIPDALDCKGDNCHEFKIYFLENIVDDNLTENYETFYVADGTILGTDELVKYTNNLFKMDIVKTDGETFTLTIGDFSINVGWYYKDTDEKFNFNAPIVSDVEIEMKLFDGEIDNDFLKDVYDIFKVIQ